MTKQEKIQEAYGTYWEELKNRVDENGWFKVSDYRERMSFIETANDSGFLIYNHFFTGKCEGGIDYLRPASISGIQHNNGWIKIESESDLPKEDCRCEFIRFSGKQLYGRFENIMGGLFVDESMIFEHPDRTESTTHWKPILTSVKPIY